MKIQYLGHSCFRLISDMGTTIVCDPYDSAMVGLNMPRVRADVVTVSHHHNDHDFVQALAGQPAEIDCEVTCCADDVTITSIPTFHDDERGAKRGNNLVFCFEIDGIRVVHMGDIGLLDENVVSRIAKCDVLLLPVGGTYTVDASAAKRYVDEVKPHIVIPMHYKRGGCKLDIDTADKFISLFDAQDVEASQSDFLVLDDAPVNTDTRIILLQQFED